jgi:hypothetical protein
VKPARTAGRKPDERTGTTSSPQYASKPGASAWILRSAATCASRPTSRAATASAANSCRREIVLVIRRNARPYQMNGARTARCDHESSSSSESCAIVRPIVSRVRQIHGPSRVSPPA